MYRPLNLAVVLFLAAYCLISIHAYGPRPAPTDATWTFFITKKYNSTFRLIDSTFNVPMVYNSEHDQLLRMLPANGYIDNSSPAPPMTNMNMLQAFSSDLRWMQKKLIGPPSCGVAWMNTFHTSAVSSSGCSSACPRKCAKSCTKKQFNKKKSCERCRYGSYILKPRIPCHCRPKCGSSTCPSKSSVSSSDEELSYIGLSCPNKVALIEYSRHKKYDVNLEKHCSLFTEQSIVKTITTSNGETFILYPDHLIVMSPMCEIIRSIHQFFYINLLWTALDMVIDERTGALAIGFNTAYLAVYDTLNLDLFFTKYLFTTPRTTPYKLFPSAMSYNEIFYFRVYFSNRTFVAWNCLYGCSDKPIPARAGFVGDDVALPTTCRPSSTQPSFITDYKNQADIIVSPNYMNSTLQMYVTQATNYTTVAKKCVWLNYPGLKSTDKLVFYTNAKQSWYDSFYLSFTPSLDMLRIKYDIR